MQHTAVLKQIWNCVAKRTSQPSRTKYTGTLVGCTIVLGHQWSAVRWFGEQIMNACYFLSPQHEVYRCHQIVTTTQTKQLFTSVPDILIMSKMTFSFLKDIWHFAQQTSWSALRGSKTEFVQITCVNKNLGLLRPETDITTMCLGS